MLREFYRVGKKPIYLLEEGIQSIEPTDHEDRVTVVMASGDSYEVVSGARYLAQEINGRVKPKTSVFEEVFGSRA